MSLAHSVAVDVSLVWFGLVFYDSLVASLPNPRLFEHNLKLFPQTLTEETLNLTPVLPPWSRSAWQLCHSSEFRAGETKTKGWFSVLTAAAWPCWWHGWGPLLLDSLFKSMLQTWSLGPSHALCMSPLSLRVSLSLGPATQTNVTVVCLHKISTRVKLSHRRGHPERGKHVSPNTIRIQNSYFMSDKNTRTKDRKGTPSPLC